jgi:hypothetical protein
MMGKGNWYLTVTSATHLARQVSAISRRIGKLSYVAKRRDKGRVHWAIDDDEAGRRRKKVAENL